MLREFGSRLCAAGLVDEHALTRALMAATKHIEVNLFSAEANRLFESLAPRLGGELSAFLCFGDLRLEAFGKGEGEVELYE